MNFVNGLIGEITRCQVDGGGTFGVVRVVLATVYTWRDPFWKYNTQRFCLNVEQVQIKLTKFGQTNRQPKLADVRPTNKKTCRTGLTWYREAIPCQIYKVGGRGNNRWWRGDEAFKSVTGSDQIWLVLFGHAPQLNKGAERYIFKMGLSICKQLEVLCKGNWVFTRCALTCRTPSSTSPTKEVLGSAV